METDDRTALDKRRDDARERAQEALRETEEVIADVDTSTKMLYVIALTLYAREFLK